jgi:hypothetical protein
MDRARYLAEIENDANSIALNGSFEPCDLNRSTFNLAHSESDEIGRLAHDTVQAGNWAEYTLIYSSNVNACEDHGEMPDTATEAITHIAYHAYRADLIAAVSALSDDEIADIHGWHKCPECGDWNETEDEDFSGCCLTDIDDEPDDDEDDDEPDDEPPPRCYSCGDGGCIHCRPSWFL